MEVAAKKTLKIIIFFVVFGLFQRWGYGQYGALSADTVVSGLFLASIVFLFISLFGFVLAATQNAVIALIGAVALMFAVVIVGDKVTAAIPWLDMDGEAYIFTAIVCLIIIWDIYKIVKAIRGPKLPQSGKAQTSAATKEDERKELHESLKQDPQMVLYFSEQLEKQLGRKPTADEVIAYIDRQEPIDEAEL